MNAHDPNRSVIRIFCLSLSGLLVVYSAIAVYGLCQLETVNATELAAGLFRIALGVIAVGALLRWGWFAEPLDSQVRLMATAFEADYANMSPKSKIRAIVLVTMLSLLLELVLIRWLASVFPVYSFYKNFTMLACFLGLGAGYAVAEKQPCAPAMVLPMLALFVGVITVLRYDTGASYLIFSIGWLSTFDLPVYFLLGASFIVCACICYPVGQLCGKLLHSSNSLNAYSLNLVGSILETIPKTSVYLFPSDADTPYSAWSKNKIKLDRLCGMSDWVIHDLRRTLSTKMAEWRIAPPHVIERILNHITGSITPLARIYNRWNYLAEMKDALEGYERRLALLLSPPAPAKDELPSSSQTA